MDKFVIFVTVMTTVITKCSGISVEKDLSMTLAQKQTLDKFREQVKPLLNTEFKRTDLYLIRWLRARNFDINQAEAMLKKNLQWRHEKKMDTIGKEDFSDIRKDLPTTIDTYDRQGRPVGVVDMYLWDIREAVLAGKARIALRYLDMLMENLTVQVYERQKLGMNVTQWTVLANAENFNMVTHGCPICIPIWVQFLYSLENNYPGWVDELIVVDATQAAFTVLNMLKPFLSKPTREAIKIFDSNKNTWMPYMDARVSRSERRPAYGGTKPPIERH